MVHMTKQAEVWAVPALRSFARNGQDPRKLEAALHHHADAVRLAAVEAVASVRPRAPDGIDYEALLGHLRDDPSPAVQRKVNQLLAAEP